MEEKFDDVMGCSCDECERSTGTCELISDPERLPSNYAEMIKITEKDKEIIKGWFVSAKEVGNYQELTDFLETLMTKYTHDYGTIVEAMTAGAIATIHVMNEDEYQGGITGFQAGCIMWNFIQKFMYYDGPMRLLSFDKMLYPQYEYNFNRTISKDIWKWLQEKAKEKLICKGDDDVHPDVKAHWQSIVDGVVPFRYKVSGDEE